jgi:hypothetical protein
MTKHKRLGLLGLLLGCICLHSCYYDVESELYPGGCEVPTQLTYTEHIKPIIDASCAISGCHVSGGDGPGNYTTYAGLQSSLDDGSFNQRVLVDRDMPPNGSLTDCQIQFINQWIQNGAAE